MDSKWSNIQTDIAYYLPYKECNGEYIEKEDAHGSKQTEFSHDWHTLKKYA